jgi:truncated hemoglobin YjbI
MEEAENLEDLSQRPVPKPVRGEVFEEWSNLMADAAEEIRSVL